MSRNILWYPVCDRYYMLNNIKSLKCPKCGTLLWNISLNYNLDKKNMECKRCGCKDCIIVSKSRGLCIGCDYLYDRWFEMKKSNHNLLYKSRNSKNNIAQFIREVPPIKLKFDKDTVIDVGYKLLGKD